MMVGGLPAYLLDLPLQVPHPGLPGPAVDDVDDGLLVDAYGVLLQAVPLELFGKEVTPGDLVFLLGDVPGEPDHLHPVGQHPAESCRGCSPW